MIEEDLQVLFDLNGIVFHLCNGKDAHFAVFPGAVLFQQEWQEHQQATVMHDPPYINISANLFIWRKFMKNSIFWIKILENHL